MSTAPQIWVLNYSWSARNLHYNHTLLCMFICLFIHLFSISLFCLFICLFVYLFVCLLVCLFTYLKFLLFLIYLFTYLFVCLFVSDDGRSEFDSSIMASMEINGITYQGVLFAQTPQHLLARVWSTIPVIHKYKNIVKTTRMRCEFDINKMLLLASEWLKSALPSSIFQLRDVGRRRVPFYHVENSRVENNCWTCWWNN